MILNFLEIGAITSLSIYLVGWRVGLSRRRAYAWNMLSAQLQPKQGDREFCNQSPWDEEQIATPEEMTRDLQGANGLWKMFENARVMLDMADFAARNSDSVDPELLAALRNDVTQIRVCVLAALAEQACSQVNEGASASVSRAASIYAGMVARTAEVLQVNVESLAPSFACTM